VERGQHGLESYQELSLVMEAANAERVLSHALDHMGDHDQARVRIENAIEIYRDAGQIVDEKNGIISLAYTLGYLGDFANAVAAVNQAHDISNENDLPWSLSWQEQFVDGLERGEVPIHEHPEPADADADVELGGRFTEAVALAAELHGAQRRKTSPSEPLGPPYVSHLLGVAGLVIDAGGDEDEAIAALFHDAIEDTSMSAEDLQVLFGQSVANIVVECSDANTIPKPPWRERKERHLEHLESADSSVLLVTAADKLWNLRSILRDLEYVGPGVWDRFNALPKDIAWYYASAAEVLTQRLPSPLIRELNSAVDELQQRLS
jgi:tetratricopeptide (TPR) repeat protein